MMNWGDYFTYDSELGVLLWKLPRPRRHIGSVAGNKHANGRCWTVHVTIYGKQKRFYAHRVIWEMCHGNIPDGMCIDHIDGDGLNNRIDNLRAVTLSENQRNRRLVITSKTGIHGVINQKGGYSIYCAKKYIAWKKDFFEACCTRKSAEIRLGYHVNHGRIL